MPLVGQYNLTLDSQYRVILPDPFLKALGVRFVITGLDMWGHISLFPLGIWRKEIGRLEAESTIVDRTFTLLLPLLGAQSSIVKLDDKRRFMIPVNLRDMVEPKLILVGAGETARLFKESQLQSTKVKANRLVKVTGLRFRKEH